MGGAPRPAPAPGCDAPRMRRWKRCAAALEGAALASLPGVRAKPPEASTSSRAAPFSGGAMIFLETPVPPVGSRAIPTWPTAIRSSAIARPSDSKGLHVPGSVGCSGSSFPRTPSPWPRMGRGRGEGAHPGSGVQGVNRFGEFFLGARWRSGEAVRPASVAR
jgi:hypothetical protein